MKEFRLQQMMRWYGPKDPVSLSDIRQAGCNGVVSALHHIPPGEIWNDSDIGLYKKEIVAAGLEWTVVESLPVHEDIKTRSGNFIQFIDNYKTSIENLSNHGIKVVTYNFMPILDWLRTDVAYTLENGSEALRFDMTHYKIFDLFILNRPTARNEYPDDEIIELKRSFDSMSDDSKNKLFENLLLGLPGDDKPFTTNQIFSLLNKYTDIDRKRLKTNLILFLKEITPACEDANIQLAIHPDDPPFSILGLPRIMSSNQDIQDLISAVPSNANGLCFCTGSFGAIDSNDIVEMLKKWGERIHFLHLRNSKRDGNGNFFEANHLEGDTNMYEVMKEIIKIMHREKRSIPMRPDHGHKMLDDKNKNTYPGYSGIGRLKSLAELRGLEYGLLNEYHNSKEN